MKSVKKRKGLYPSSYTGSTTITLGEYLERCKNQNQELATEEYKDWLANRTEA